MSQSIPRKAVPATTEEVQVPQRVSSMKAKTQVVADQTAPASTPLHENVRDMDYLGPLVSRMSLEDDQDREISNIIAQDQVAATPPRPSAEAVTSTQYSTGQYTTPPPRQTYSNQVTSTPPRVPRTSLDKPLPIPPNAEPKQRFPDLDHLPAHPGVRPSPTSQARGEEGLIRPRDIRSARDLDLTDTEDTTVSTSYAPAVTHETIVQKVHVVEEPRITREIHTHQVYHRTLPIIDIEVKPARHFVESGGYRREVLETELPNHATKDVQRLLAESVKKTLPKGSSSPGTRQFTAREFTGSVGDYKENLNSRGTLQTARTWVHPPTLEQGGRESGQTAPFHLGYADPSNEGLRDGL